MSTFRSGDTLCERYLVLQPFHVPWGEGAVVRDRVWNGATHDVVVAPPGREEAFLARAAAWRDLPPDRHLLAAYYTREISGRVALLVDHPSGARFEPGRFAKGEPTAMLVAAQLARAMAHVHAAAGVHGNLEPTACLLTDRDCVRLGRLHLAGGPVGMPWRAPEQWAPEATPTAAADVYAFGAILYELCTGRRVFDASAQVREYWWKIVQQHSGVQGFVGLLRGRKYKVAFPAAMLDALSMAALPPELEEPLMRYFHTSVELPPVELDPGVPGALREVFVACLDKDPRRRPTAAEVARMLEERVNYRSEPLLPGELTVARCNRVAALVEMDLVAQAKAELDGWLAKPPPDPLLWAARATVEIAARPEAICDLEARFDAEVRPFHPAIDRDPEVTKFLERVSGSSVRVEGPVTSVSVSPDGTVVAVAWAHSRRVCVWTVGAGPGSGTRTVHVEAEEPAQHVTLLSNDRLLVATRSRLFVQGLDTPTVAWFRAYPAPIGAVAVSASRRAVLACGSELQLFDAATGEITRTLDVGGATTRLAIDPSGDAIAALVDGALVEIDAREGSMRRLELGLAATGLCFARDLPLFTDEGEVAIASSPDGSILAVSELSGRLLIRDVRGGAVLRTLNPPGGPIRVLAFTPDGATVVAGDDGGSVRLWSARAQPWPSLMLPSLSGQHSVGSDVSRTVQEKSLFLLDTGLASGVTVSPTGTRLDWSTSYRGRVTAVAFSRDGRRIAVAERHTIHLSHLQGRRLHFDVQELTHDNDLQALAYNAEGTRLVAGTGHWRATGEEVKRPSDAARLSGMAQSKGQSFALFPGETVIGRHPQCELVLHGPSVSRRHCVIDHAEGRYVLRDLNSANGVTLNGARVAEALLREGDVLGIGEYSFRFEMVPDEGNGLAETAPSAPDRRYTSHPSADTNILRREDLDPRIFTGEFPIVKSNAAVLWDCGAGLLLRAMHGHDGPVTAVAFLQDGSSILTASQDGTLILWDASDGRLIRRFPEPAGPAITSLALSPDDRVVAAGGVDGRIVLWDLREAKLLATIAGHRGSVLGVAFSGDGRMLASGGRDGTARLWRTRTQQSIGVCEGHTGAVSAVAFSPDDRMLLTGSADGTARLWNRWNGTGLHTIELRGSVSAIAFSPDGRLVVTGGEDGAVQAWLMRWLWAYVDDLVGTTERFVEQPNKETWLWPLNGAEEPDLDLMLDVWRDLTRCGATEGMSDEVRERYAKVRTRLLYMVVEWLRKNGHAPRLVLGAGGREPKQTVDADDPSSPWAAIGQADRELAAQVRMRIA